MEDNIDVPEQDFKIQEWLKENFELSVTIKTNWEKNMPTIRKSNVLSKKSNLDEILKDCPKT